MAQRYLPATDCFNDTFNLTVYSEDFLCSKLEFNVSTCLPIQTAQEIHTIKTLCAVADTIWIVGFWLSVILGIVGNGLAILTIASLPTSTATFFVGLLAVSDLIGVCIQVVVQYLDKYRVYNRARASWELLPMMNDTIASYSNWLLVFICLERYFTVRFPLHKKYYFTLKHARISAVVLAIFIFTIYNCTTWTIGYADTRMFKIRNVIYALLPLTFILIIIGLISYQLRLIHKDRQSLNGRVHSRIGLASLDNQQSPGSGPKKSYTSSPLDDIARLENSITIMMLVAAVCFSVLTIPNCIVLHTYLYSATSWNTPVLRSHWYLFRNISQVLTFLNLSVNFVLYFLSAKRFRAQLFKVIFARPWLLLRGQSKNLPPLNNNSKADSIRKVLDVDYLRHVSDTSPAQTDFNISSESITDGIPLSSVIEGTTRDGDGQSPVEAGTKEKYESYPVLRYEVYGSSGSML